jgi:molybdopterin converting factor small subunit
VKLRVLLFASWADALRAPSVELDVDDGATAGDVLLALGERTGVTHLPRPAVAVNRKIAPATTRLSPGDEVAIIPPVSGG